MAMLRRNVGASRHLVAAGASVNLATALGWAPLHFAVHAGSAELVTLLRLNSTGAELDVEPTTQAGLSPLHMAVMAQNPDMCTVLCQLGAAPDSVSAASAQTDSQSSSTGTTEHGSPWAVAQQFLEHVTETEEREVAKSVVDALVPQHMGENGPQADVSGPAKIPIPAQFPTLTAIRR